ncbi:MAG: MiaB/RimO family radical SAM methylthiotransferase, partial [Oscillospiraceae bacterium]
CNNFCSYCIVPYVKGREASRNPEKIIEEAKGLIEKGYKEITLLGQNVNSYGGGLENPMDFPTLIKRIDSIEGDYMVRFMTSHPKDCTHELIDAVGESRHFAKHFHLPVQSGSNRILKDMNRHYTVEDYLSLIAYARAKIPEVTFSADIIVGFPNETEEDFLGTIELIKKVRYNALYTFIYSKRSGTPAALIEDKVGYEEKAMRMSRLLKVQRGINQELNHELVGKTIRVLFDGCGKNPNEIIGRTTGNIIAIVNGGEELLGGFGLVKILEAAASNLHGEIREP